MKNQQTTSLGDQLLVAALFLLAGLGLLIFFVKFAEPTHPVHRAPYQGNYSEQQLLERLTATNLDARVVQIAAASIQPGERQVGRATGSLGFYRTEKIIEATFQAAGLEMQKQEFEVIMPETEYCEVLGADGQPLPGVQLYPYEPAGLVPIVLPPEGIKARLVTADGTDLNLIAGNAPRETILLTTVENSAGWVTPAGAGVRALIVQEDAVAKSQRADPDKPAPWNNIFSGLESYFPRFVARGPIEKFSGQEITIRCKVTWQSKKVRNLIGVLRGKGTGKEALVVTAYYDAASMVPELAPGAEQSLSLVTLLEYAQAMAPYRGQFERDIVFVATAGHAQAQAGACRLMEAVETFSRTRTEYQSLADRRVDQVRQLEYSKQALQICGELKKEKAPTPEQFKARWLKDPKFAVWFEDAFKQVAGEINLDRRNEMLAAKLTYFRAGKPIFREGINNPTTAEAETAQHPLLRAYIEAQTHDNTAANLMGLPVEELAGRPEFTQWDYLAKAVEGFEARRVYHENQIKQLEDSIAVQKIFGAYDQTLTLNLDLFSGGHLAKQSLAVAVNLTTPGTVVEPQVSDVVNSILAKVPEKGPGSEINVIHWGSRDATGNYANPSPISPLYTTVGSAIWFRCGKVAFSVMNSEFTPQKIATPEDTWDGLSTKVLQMQVPVLGRSILAIASGQVPFKQIPPLSEQIFSVHGTVLGNAGAASVVPTHRMGIRTFVRAHTKTLVTYERGTTRGVTLYPVLQANPYGEFDRELTGDLKTWDGPFSAKAVRFDGQGNVEYVNDTSASSQSLFKSQAIDYKDAVANGPHPAKPINLSMFRAAPVSFYEQINPQTMKAFKSVAILDRVSLDGPARYNFSGSTYFLESDMVFFVGLQDGAADNKELLTDRAFMLNVDPREAINTNEPAVYGHGYLVADTDVLVSPAFDAAGSMLRTSEKRLTLQEHFGMADEQMISFHKQGKEWLADAQEKMEQKDPANAVTAANTSLAYAINNHPVIRSRVSQAVVGILWYLGLLVPFVFFAEKLLFGYPDIRKQLLAIGIIFLVVFTLLRLFHPAFEMVRSSLMILLGFVILLLTLVVTLMVGGKFKQNLKELRSKEGRVEGADINRGGVVGTAFMLGLNNMRRRKIRTGLTCATLVLITFVMICFTSVSTNLVNVEQPTGRSTWNGLMVSDPTFWSLGSDEANRVIANLRQFYGTRYPITTHEWLVAQPATEGGMKNTEIAVDREFTIDGTKVVKRGKVSAAIKMEWREPQFSGIDRYLLTKKGWFPKSPETKAERLVAQRAGYKERPLVVLPDNLARDLGIRVEDVNQTNVFVTIRGVDYEVQGIVDSAELVKIQGLNGQSILPYDLNSVQSLGSTAVGGDGAGQKSILPIDVGRLPATQVILVNTTPTAKGGSDASTVAGVMVLFPKTAYHLKADGPEFPSLDYKTQRRLVLGYLERIGQPAYYAIDGVAYYGSRQRATTFAGLLELLVPILIAALTVFNTMRGSVYERKSEIYVYNAVGIAPNHVFFMFMAEACVYAVIGAVLGYILSQGTGRLLTKLDLTGGLNMDYSSIETIYASLAIMASVLLSTIIPARDAAKLAAPSDVVSWAVPKAEGDAMTFNLPFTFTAHDRVAVISYFQRWLDANGAGSSGPFFCSPPEVQLTGETELVPVVVSTVWLKPYDLGVSQRMEISLPIDRETTEYIARIKLTRLSGHVAGWNRTLRPFLGVLRKQFLNWRATTDGERREMFTEASGILTECAAKEETHA